MVDRAARLRRRRPAGRGRRRRVREVWGGRRRRGRAVLREARGLTPRHPVFTGCRTPPARAFVG
ncbi:hypothetical protein E5344_14560 [Microbacterium laevaniformans]|uniref:Uncharacterized protein n=1 Tax=Microbacterium laevaniformans TaxID=36807 RepID=A0A4S2CWC6_9MICO|nr:hypothetical protein E5344_14560 [Microbacterium laevaniformans]